MKVMAKTLVLVLLLAATCSATYLAAFAAEDFPDDEEMVTYNTPQTREYDVETRPGTALRGSAGSGNIENAPALRVDNQVVIPQVPLEPADEEEGAMETPYSAPPDTGAVSFGFQLAAALATLGGSAAIGRKKDNATK